MGNVLAAARELLHQRHYDEVVEACHTALAVVPHHVGLRLLLAESLMSMRRDAEAQLEVAAALKASPNCPEAFRLLGALAYRRQELRAAEVFLLQALRAAPGDQLSAHLLEKVRQRKTPAAAAAKLPAASAAAGTSFAPASVPAPPKRRALGTEPMPTLQREAKLRRERPVPEPLLAKGSSRIDAAEKTTLDPVDRDFGGATATEDHPLTTIDEVQPEEGLTNEMPRLERGVQASAPRKNAWVRPDTYHGEPTRARARMPEPESVALRLGHLGFGEYLVMTGVLTRWQLYRVLQVQDWKRMRVGEAAVELGYISPKRVAQLLAAYQETLVPEADTVA